MHITTEQAPARFYWLIVLIMFLCAAGLRFSLAVYNRQANDNHYQVVQLILEGRSGLTMANCRECFHPKLFYHVCAALIRTLGLPSGSSQIVAGQLLNSAAGLVTLGLIFFSLHASPFDAKWRLWTFGLIALNPRLIAINGQLSNDSFAILFSTATVFLTLLLLRSPSVWLGVLVQLVLSWSLMTKGTTWVVAIAVLIIFFVGAMLNKSKSHRLLFVGLYIATAINGFISIQMAGYDFEHYNSYASTNVESTLYIWEKTSVARPGVLSIVDGYLTFRLVDLLRNPQITNSYEYEQRHRTSVWTQLYARANLAQFEQHPRSWLTTDGKVLLLARCSFTLGLLPLLFFLVGLTRGIFRSLSAWQTWGAPWSLRDPPSPGVRDLASLFCLLVCLGSIAFIIKFTANFRGFTAMKLIYILPGVLPFSLVLLEGMQKVGGQLCRVKFAECIVHVVLLCLVVCYCTGIIALVQHLASCT
jgi:hypothetical protein